LPLAIDEAMNIPRTLPFRCMTLTLGMLLLSCLLASCSRDDKLTVTGRVRNSVTGEPIPNASISRLTSDSVLAYSGRDGFFTAVGIRPGDTLQAYGEGFHQSLFALPTSAVAGKPLLHEFYLDPRPDTAYTASGPVDASVFLDNSQLKRKKLSINEARIILTQKFEGARVYKGTLVTVSEKEEWLFELKFSRASASVYLDAYSGEIRSIESDDPNLDKKLQSMIDK
jgi:hypothetical protein